MTGNKDKTPDPKRRKFVKQCIMGSCGLALGAYALRDFFGNEVDYGLKVGFRNDAPEKLWKWSKEAQWYTRRRPGSSAQVSCKLCPHECILGENDRGFCRTRVVKEGKLYTLAYGNPCSVNVDPIEKKPLFHFLPGTSIVSVATAGCNLRCLNCQNWQISQSKPEDVQHVSLFPEELVKQTSFRGYPSIAYTYTDPIVFYEYVYDSSKIAKEKKIKNVLVTAGYILPKPLKQLCRVVDAANVDLKGFNEFFYKKVCGATLKPVLKSLEIMREEGVWLEITNLVVPTYSDDLKIIRKLVKWIANNLGSDVPLHFSRFHPDYRLKRLPYTPIETLKGAREIAKEEGLKHVYIGNIPEGDGQNTVCPECGEVVIERHGYQILSNRLNHGKCPCGEVISGIWSV